MTTAGNLQNDISTKELPPDPFTAMGGGVYVNGNWVPKDHPLANPAPAPTESAHLPSLAPPRSGAGTVGGQLNPSTVGPMPLGGSAQQPAANANDPFAAMGGGVQLSNGNWVPKDHPLAQQQALSQNPAGTPAGNATGSGATTTAQQAVTGNTTVGGYHQQGSSTNVASAFQQALINKLAPPPVNAANPGIVQALKSNQYAQQRGVERGRKLAAEQAAAGGYDGSGAFQSQLFGLEQARAAQEGAFEGGMIRDLQKQQDQQLMQALALGGGQLIDQDRLAMQRYGMDLDAQLRREGLGTQRELGLGDLGLRGELGRGQLNLGLLNLLQGGEQFGQSLSADLGKFNASLNNQSLLALLGGL